MTSVSATNRACSAWSRVCRNSTSGNSVRSCSTQRCGSAKLMRTLRRVTMLLPLVDLNFGNHTTAIAELSPASARATRAQHVADRRRCHPERSRHEIFRPNFGFAVGKALARFFRKLIIGKRRTRSAARDVNAALRAAAARKTQLDYRRARKLGTAFVFDDRYAVEKILGLFALNHGVCE